MTTRTHIQRALAAAAALVAACTAAGVATGAGPARRGATLAPVAASARPGHLLTSTRSYGWPVKPFDRQHPVRGFLNDPRISGGSETFHFGVDVVAPDRTPVYAVEAGVVQLHSGPAVIVHSGSHWTGYWHIDAVVRPGQVVRLHQFLGRIGKGWGHVHLAEYRNGLYVNPLRPGGLGPYADRSAPSIDAVRLRVVAGGFALEASATDLPSPGVPGVWAGEPVSPALLRWRLIRDGEPGAWRTAIDSRTTLLDSNGFRAVYATGTRQNHPGKAGRYWFSLDGAWHPQDGTYRLELEASDTAGNTGTAVFRLGIRAGAVVSAA